MKLRAGSYRTDHFPPGRSTRPSPRVPHFLADRSAKPRLRKWTSFLLGEKAASASEYAAIFAVVVIALMVCVNILGRNLGRAVQSANARINGGGAYTLGTGPAGGASVEPSKEPNEESGKLGSAAEAAHGPPTANDTVNTPDRAAGSSDERSNEAPPAVSAARKIFQGDQSGPSPKKN